MSLQNHSLEVDGRRKTLEEWGIDMCTFREEAGGREVLRWRRRMAIDAEEDMPGLTEVKLYDFVGKLRFKGTILSPVKSGRMEAETRSYEAHGVWLRLELQPMKQAWKFAVEVDESVSVELEEVTLAILGRVTVKEECEAVVTAANAAGIELDADLDQVPGGADEKNPEDRQRDLHMAGVLQKALAWNPYLSLRFDHDPEDVQPTKLRIFSTLKPGNGYMLPSTPFPVRTANRSDLAEFRGSERLELLRSAVTIHYVTRLNTEIAGTPVTLKVRETETATPTSANGALAPEELTIELRPPYPNDEGVYAEGERKPVGLAKRMGVAYFDRWSEFEFRLDGQEVNWGVRVGELWNVTGAGEEFSDAWAVCQVIERDIANGTTRITCGPPTQLGLSVERELARVNRLRAIPTRNDVRWQMDGEASDDEKAEGEAGPLPTDFVVFMDPSGERKRVRILAEILPGEIPG